MLHALFLRVYDGLPPRGNPRCVELVYSLGDRSRETLRQFAAIHALFAALTAGDEIQVAAMDHATYSALVAALLPTATFTGEVREYLLAALHTQHEAYLQGPAPRRRGEETHSGYTHDTFRVLPLSIPLFLDIYAAAPDRLLTGTEVTRFLVTTSYALFLRDQSGQCRVAGHRPPANNPLVPRPPRSGSRRTPTPWPSHVVIHPPRKRRQPRREVPLPRRPRWADPIELTWASGSGFTPVDTVMAEDAAPPSESWADPPPPPSELEPIPQPPPPQSEAAPTSGSVLAAPAEQSLPVVADSPASPDPDEAPLPPRSPDRATVIVDCTVSTPERPLLLVNSPVSPSSSVMSIDSPVEPSTRSRVHRLWRRLHSPPRYGGPLCTTSPLRSRPRQSPRMRRPLRTSSCPPLWSTRRRPSPRPSLRYSRTSSGSYPPPTRPPQSSATITRPPSSTARAPRSPSRPRSRPWSPASPQLLEQAATHQRELAAARSRPLGRPMAVQTAGTSVDCHAVQTEDTPVTFKKSRRTPPRRLAGSPDGLGPRRRPGGQTDALPFVAAPALPLPSTLSGIALLNTIRSADPLDSVTHWLDGVANGLHAGQLFVALQRLAQSVQRLLACTGHFRPLGPLSHSCLSYTISAFRRHAFMRLRILIFSLRLYSACSLRLRARPPVSAGATFPCVPTLGGGECCGDGRPCTQVPGAHASRGT